MVFEKEYIMRCSSAEWTARNGLPWDNAIVVSAGKLRKLLDFLSELRSSLCERRLERTVLRPALLPVKIAQLDWECIAPFTDADKPSSTPWSERLTGCAAQLVWTLRKTDKCDPCLCTKLGESLVQPTALSRKCNNAINVQQPLMTGRTYQISRQTVTCATHAPWC